MPLSPAKATAMFLVIGLMLVQCTYGGSTYRRTKTYHNDIVVACSDKSDKRVQIMMKNDNVDVWRVHSSGRVDMKLRKSLYAAIQDYVSDVCHVSVGNVEASVQQAEAQMLSDWQLYPGQIANTQEVNTDEDWFKEYHNLEAMTMWYKKLTEENPKIMKFVKSIGKTSEGRHIFAVHISEGINDAHLNSDRDKPKFYMQCLIHAREWISGSSCMYQAMSLVQGYKNDDTKIKDLVKSMEFVIVPVVNPDGYAYTWSKDRLWRKNRAITMENGECQGVDLNRNFPVGWGNDKTACSETYAGASPGSERETQAIMQYYTHHEPYTGGIDFHSYGELILRPYGYTKKGCSDEAVMAEVGKDMSRKIASVNGEHYTSEKSHDLYEAHGIASDWFYSKNANHDHTALAYTIELRGHSFLLPKEQILATCQEANSAFLDLAGKSLVRFVNLQLNSH